MVPVLDEEDAAASFTLRSSLVRLVPLRNMFRWRGNDLSLEKVAEICDAQRRGGRGDGTKAPSLQRPSLGTGLGIRSVSTLSVVCAGLSSVRLVNVQVQAKQNHKV